MKETIQAITHWNVITKNIHLVPSSWRIVAMAAIQGVYRRQKTNREYAVAADITSAIATPLKRDEMTATTTSFANTPLTRALTTRQSPYPIGLKMGAIMLAIWANIL